MKPYRVDVTVLYTKIVIAVHTVHYSKTVTAVLTKSKGKTANCMTKALLFQSTRKHYKTLSR